MKKILAFLFVSIAYAYTDPELETLWASLSNISNPTLEDYKKVEEYLKYGKRPYFENLRNNSIWWGFPDYITDTRIAERRYFKLLGPYGEMPIVETHALNVTEKTQDRCILIYASHIDREGAYRLLDELKKCGYSGHVMVRIGGFPNLSNGGLKFCPFSLAKPEFIREARDMGFKKILVLESFIHPLNDLNTVFKIVDKMGYYLINATDGSIQHLPVFDQIPSLQFQPSDCRNIPWLPGYVIGFNFDHQKGNELFTEWDRALKNIEQLDILSSEEIFLSILTWKHQLIPADTYQHRADLNPNDVICRSFHHEAFQKESSYLNRSTDFSDRELKLINHVINSVDLASREISKLPRSVLDISGMSSHKVRHLLNNLCSLPNTGYLEIGTWKRSTLISSLYNNRSNVSFAVALDNWSEFFAPSKEFTQNCETFLEGYPIRFYEADAFQINLSIFTKPVTLYFYDGGHAISDQELAFTYYDPVFENVFIAVIDDWNNPNVPIGTRIAFGELGYTILYEHILPARHNCDGDQWWNGLYVGVIRKPRNNE